ncbi:MAG: hypothetical protein AB1782_06155 [Cyanobacteriota bacterium]
MKRNLRVTIYKLKKLIKPIKVFNYEIEDVFKYTLITAILLTLIIIIFGRLAFDAYINSNYFIYLVNSSIYFIVIIPITSMMSFPIILILNNIYNLVIKKRSQKFGSEEKRQILQQIIQNGKIKSISADKLSDIALLPVEEVMRIMNILVAEGKSEISIDDYGGLIYSFNESIDVKINNIVKRIFDAN